MADETLNELRQALDDAMLTRTGRSIGDLASQRVLDDIMPYIAALQPAQPADEPRAIVRAFALLGMERKLAANDGVKGGWRDTGTFALLDLMRHEISEFQVAMYQFINAEDRDVAEAELALLRQDVLDEAADVANYLMMLCDVCGALPPTDERGR